MADIYWAPPVILFVLTVISASTSNVSHVVVTVQHVRSRKPDARRANHRFISTTPLHLHAFQTVLQLVFTPTQTTSNALDVHLHALHVPTHQLHAQAALSP